MKKFWQIKYWKIINFKNCIFVINFIFLFIVFYFFSLDSPGGAIVIFFTTCKKTQEISSFKLIKCINNHIQYKKKDFELKSKNIENCSNRNINNIYKEIYKRFVIPFYLPILTLIPFLIIIISKESPKYHKLRLLTFLIGLIIIIFSETTIRFITENNFKFKFINNSNYFAFNSVFIFFL